MATSKDEFDPPELFVASLGVHFPPFLRRSAKLRQQGGGGAFGLGFRV